MTCKALTLGALALPAVLLWGCDSAQDPLDRFGDCTKCDFIEDSPQDDLGKRWRGQDEFESAAPFWDFFSFGTLESAARSDGATERSVEEADVYHYDADSGLLYVLNSYRGLQVIDASDADDPKLIGRAPLGGYPIEMYQRGDHAFVLLSSLAEPGENAGEHFTGSMLRVYDLADPTEPEITVELPIAGTVAGSRLLAAADGSSTVIYVMSNVYSWQFDSLGATETTFVQSIDVTDATAPVAVDRVDFDGSGWQVHVTPQAMFVADHDWTVDQTRIRYVDISDFGGDVVVRDSVSVEGRLSWGDAGELQMDHEGTYLRVASSYRGDFQAGTPGGVRISTISTYNPDHMTVAGTLNVGEGHRIVATRFEGDRCYLFHMVNVDPLEIIDLSNPQAPESMGILEIDGWVNHIEVRDNKLLTLGVDDTDNRVIAFILFDVTDPENPVELDRATAGQDWAWTAANHDLKSFRVVDELGVAMLPISSSSWDDDGRYRYRQWLQLFSFDLDGNDVATRGEIENLGGVKRSFPAGNSVIAFSDRQLVTVDMTDLDKPDVTASLELARDVRDFTTVGPFGVMSIADGDWQSGQTAELRVVSLHAPDDTAPLATLELGVQPGRIFKLSEQRLVHVASDPVAGDTVVQVVDFEDPIDPSIMSTTRLPELGFQRWSRFVTWAPAPGPDATLVGDSLVFFGWPTDSEDAGAKLRVLSFENPAFPHISAVVELGAETVVGMDAVGDRLYVSSYESLAAPANEGGVIEGEPVVESDPISMGLPGGVVGPSVRSGRAAYSLRIVDLADASAPVTSEPISVPGPFAGTTTVGTGASASTILFTKDIIPQEFGSADALDTMLLVGTEKVRLLDVYGLPSGAQIQIDGESAYVATSGWWSGPFRMDTDGASPFRPSFELSVLDLSTPDTIALAGTYSFDDASYGNLVAVSGGRAVVSAGWSSLRVIDLQDPADAHELGRFPTLGWWQGNVSTDDAGRFYLPSGLFGLQVVDVD